jgi:hypothetical protein
LRRVEAYQRFSAIAVLMEAAGTSETSVNFYQSKGAATQKTAIFVDEFVRTSKERATNT